MAAAQFQMLQSWGVASARHTSGSLVYPSQHSTTTSGHTVPSSDSGHNDTEQLFDVPIGPSIIRWDLKTKKRLLQFQAHSDLVTCMRMSPDKRSIATSCFSGEVKLWNTQWVCLDQVTAPMGSQHHLAWSHDSKRFLIVGNGFNSSVVVYDIISSHDDKQNSTHIKQAWQTKTDQSQTIPQQTSDTPPVPEALKNTGWEYHYGSAYYMAEINPSGNVFAVEERPKKTTLVHLYSPEGKPLKTVELRVTGVVAEEVEKEKKGGSGDVAVHTLFISKYNSGCYAIACQGGHVMLLDAESLETKKAFKVGYSSRTCVWDGDHLVLPSDSGKLTWWSKNGNKVTEFQAGSADYIVRLEWSVSGNSLWMCGFSSLTRLNVERNERGVISSIAPLDAVHSHEITCCGVGFNTSGRYLGSGDLAGKVWVTQRKECAPLHQCSVGMSVRCLVWRDEQVVFVGCLDGVIHQWDVGEGTTTELLHLEGSVICMRFDHKHKCFAVGTSKGVLSVYQLTEDKSNVTNITAILAHPPQPGNQDMRFGQLGKQAEIWSLCWSPDDKRVATSSEDQTTKIWDTSNWKCIALLTGHTMAVTSVDWKKIGEMSIIATCADDRTIRLTDGEIFKLIRILDTKDIHGWHTLTYLAFQPIKDSSLIVCTTQNGHVVVWNALSGKRLTRGKLHCGSIEGLAWKEDHETSGSCLATVGADCVVNLFTIITKSTCT